MLPVLPLSATSLRRQYNGMECPQSSVLWYCWRSLHVLCASNEHSVLVRVVYFWPLFSSLQQIISRVAACAVCVPCRWRRWTTCSGSRQACNMMKFISVAGRRLAPVIRKSNRRHWTSAPVSSALFKRHGLEPVTRRFTWWLGTSTCHEPWRTGDRRNDGGTTERRLSRRMNDLANNRQWLAVSFVISF